MFIIYPPPLTPPRNLLRTSTRAHVHLPLQEGGVSLRFRLRVRRGGDVLRAAALRSVRVRALNFSAAAAAAAAAGSPSGISGSPARRPALGLEVPPNPAPHPPPNPVRRSRLNEAAVEHKARKKGGQSGERPGEEQSGAKEEPGTIAR